VVGLADLSALPPKILDFCGTLPIYEIEEKENPSDNTALGEDSAKKTYDENIMQRNIMLSRNQSIRNIRKTSHK